MALLLDPELPMDLLLLFAIVLLVAVLLSEVASRSILSTAVLFLGAGFLAGNLQGFVDIKPDDHLVEVFSELALFSVLFTDGMHLNARQLGSAWRLAGRALVIGMPLTFLIMAVLGRYLVTLPWSHAFLVAAALAPTDPVFAAAIVGRKDVPERLRRLLNVESGLNDGLALPIVLAMLAVAGAHETEPLRMLYELALGVGLGITLPCLAWWLERRPLLSAHGAYEPFLAFSVALLLYAVSAVTHANPFLAAFAGGVTVSSLGDAMRKDFEHFGNLVTELLKLAALLLFGALIAPADFADFELGAYVFVIMVLVLARPAALLVSLAGSRLSARERLVAAWFGPKGFASVFYALLILHAGLQQSARLYHLIAGVIAVSMVVHSSTDVIVARWLKRQEPDARWGGRGP